jgi:uncharacterized protein YegP (UPF0339 family)
MTDTNVENIYVFQDDSGQWRWHAKAANGEIVATGESHSRKEDAARAAEAVFPGFISYEKSEE